MNTANLSFYHTFSYKLTLCLSTAAFFYIFLVFFLPFGVDNYNPHHKYTIDFFLEIFNFFIVILFFLSLNEFLLRPYLVRKTNIYTIVWWSLWRFLLLSTALFFTYNILGEWHDFRWRSYLGFIVNCSSVLVFPTVGTFFYFRHRSLEEQVAYILTSKEKSPSIEQLINFSGQGSKDQITLAASIFLYGRAQDNYVELYYLEQGQPKKFLMRASLHNLTKSIKHPAVVRCHRSYFVNLQQVNAIKSGRNEIDLYIDTIEGGIPVSRSYREDVMEHLKQLKDFTE